MSDKTTDNTDWLDEVLEQLAFEVADRHFRKSGNGYAERRKLDDVDVARAKQAIQQHEQQAIKGELEDIRLQAEWLAYDDAEGEAIEAVDCKVIDDRIATLSTTTTKEGEAE